MKRIRALDGPTPGLADYQEHAGDDGSYSSFRDHKYDEDGVCKNAYRELVSSLQDIQHGLCGYCEIDIIESDRQIEHVIPRSDPEQGRNHALDPTNMMVCCQGGARRSEQDPERRTNPVRDHRSCGGAKQALSDPDFIDPRTLPALPALMRVDNKGKIMADVRACQDASFDVNKVNKTIEILGLNVRRLQLAREKHWRALSENYQKHFDDPQVIQEAARMELLPGKDNRLPRFFTTSRSYFRPVAEKILEEAPQEWI